MEAVEDAGARAVHDVEVAFVCTANRARSPFAAAVLARRVAGLPVRVTSFGIREQRGAPVLLHALRAARAFGIDLARHRARALRPGDLTTCDLVVGFEYAHVAEAVMVGGAERARAFLMSELADTLVQAEIEVVDGPRGFAAAVHAADESRRRAATLPPGIPDPAGGTERRFMVTYGEIDRMTSVIASRLFGVWPDRP